MALYPSDSVIRHLEINGDNTQIDVTVKVPDPANHVQFDKVTRNLTLIKKVSREQTRTIDMVLSCKILSTQQTVSRINQ